MSKHRHFLILFCWLSEKVWSLISLAVQFLLNPVICKASCPLKSIIRFPWWSSGWESACQFRGYRFNPWSMKIPHAVRRLGPWATTTRPAHWDSPATTTKPARCNGWSLHVLEPELCDKRSYCSKKPLHCNDSRPGRPAYPKKKNSFKSITESYLPLSFNCLIYHY